MKNAVSIFIVWVSLVAGMAAGASESATEIAKERAFKSQLIQHLQNQIARHQGMTQEEILDELTAMNAKSVQMMAQNKDVNMQSYTETVTTSLQEMAQMDKETLIAMEVARLQNFQSSKSNRECYIFLFMHWNHEWLEKSHDYWTQGWTLIAMPFAIVGDVALFPFELLAEGMMQIHEWLERMEKAKKQKEAE